MLMLFLCKCMVFLSIYYNLCITRSYKFQYNRLYTLAMKSKTDIFFYLAFNLIKKTWSSLIDFLFFAKKVSTKRN